jgi:hypothetical protein
MVQNKFKPVTVVIQHTGFTDEAQTLEKRMESSEVSVSLRKSDKRNVLVDGYQPLYYEFVEDLILNRIPFLKLPNITVDGIGAVEVSMSYKDSLSSGYLEFCRQAAKSKIPCTIFAKSDESKPAICSVYIDSNLWYEFPLDSSCITVSKLVFSLLSLRDASLCKELAESV